jgi:glycosyltransferase involved in cell wall biosynthesis
VLRNTVDLDEVVSAAAHVSEDDVAEFRSQHGVTNNRVLAFIGGIDESKRIDFLRDVLDRLWVVDPSVQILIGGRGTQEGLLSEAVGRGQAVLLGQVGATRKVLMARASTLLVSPGRVGLVAAEALALKLHVVTTRWPFHAPEFEYLAEGIDVTQTVDDVNIYADEILRLLDEGPPVVQSRPPLLDDMVSAFRAGLLRMGI